MSSIICRIGKTTLILVLVFVILGCNYNSQSAVKAEPANISAWLAYWELDAGQKDLDKLGSSLDRLFLFGAYFDQKDRLFIPKELSDKSSELKKRKSKYTTYLTFVNDKEKADGSVIMKDTEVLRRLLTDEASLDKHVDAIIALTAQGGHDGIEIDYERVWSDDGLGPAFVHFVNRLYLQAMKKNLKLRVVLEPGTPFATAGFIKGPEYVVMLYNLYGLHSGPGPKANRDFIQKTITRMAALPGEKGVALATGGCVWGNNGKKSLVTEAEAKTLAAVNDADLKRDEESQCLVFDYKDARGITYQVWFADVKTLNYWISVAQSQGINNVSLWRLGGNVDINKLK